jgi:hypothetical protein
VFVVVSLHVVLFRGLLRSVPCFLPQNKLCCACACACGTSHLAVVLNETCVGSSMRLGNFIFVLHLGLVCSIFSWIPFVVLEAVRPRFNKDVMFKWCGVMILCPIRFCFWLHQHAGIPFLFLTTYVDTLARILHTEL